MKNNNIDQNKADGWRQIIDEIHQLSIGDVISKYIPLTPQGSSQKAKCPFHTDSSPSFSVSDKYGRYKCFGCNKSGDSIDFVQNFKGFTFLEAVKEIATQYNISIPDDHFDKTTSETWASKNSLYEANRFALNWFKDQLNKEENALALEYAMSRWNNDSLSRFSIGFAPRSGNLFLKAALEACFKEEILFEAGLISKDEKSGNYFDFFRDRLIFPVVNSSGKVAGFSGRLISDNEKIAKYLNTRQSPIYQKGDLLYGFFQAASAIRENNMVFLVEGYADVIRLHQLGIYNTIGLCGTILTKPQIDSIKKMADTVSIIGDNDGPGKDSMERSAEMLVQHGIYCNLVCLPEDKAKIDPDSFFKTKQSFISYIKENTKDFIIYYAEKNDPGLIAPGKKADLTYKICQLIIHLPHVSHSHYIASLGKIIKPKDQLEKILKGFSDRQNNNKKVANQIPDHLNRSDIEDNGFYENGNCYFFATREGFKCKSNFTMEPLYHLPSNLNAKRIFRITNKFGDMKEIELPQKELSTVNLFRLRIEGLGNFIFEGSDNDLMTLKKQLYLRTITATEVGRLGWQKEKQIWAWANGIYKDYFRQVDDIGMVNYEKDTFYLPSSSRIFQKEDTLFISERRFKFHPGTISLHDISERLIEVFGDNAIIGLCFYFASLFRDHIAELHGFFPILNLFGPKGSGKTEMAVSLLQFFGAHVKGPNLTNTSKAALADHIALLVNGFCHIDEYTNDLEIEKVEFLKGLWDGTGRTRMNMDKDKKKETTPVDCGIILTGQQMATIDNALFSRLIFLSFSKVEFSENEKDAFLKLKKIEKLGLCHITNELLNKREHFISNYHNAYDQTAQDLNRAIDYQVIEDRTFKNWQVIISSYSALKDMIKVPWTYSELITLAASMITQQDQCTKNANELSSFWETVDYLTSEGKIMQEVDFKIELTSHLHTEKINYQWPSAKRVLMINQTRIIPLYQEHGYRTKVKTLPSKSLIHYLKANKAYLGSKSSVSFKVLENGKVKADDDTPQNFGASAGKTVNRRITSAFCFDYEELGISLVLEKINLEQENESNDELPF